MEQPSLEGIEPPSREEQLLLELEGFDGPIDLLLTLARDQKVDLRQISILALAEQYLAFIDAARRMRLELAADYLVMAAWLAFLKSRLLLPQPEGEPEPTGEQMAEALAFQLRRLEAMRDVAVRLMARPRLRLDIFPRGAPEGLPIEVRAIHSATLFDLLKAYGDQQARQEYETLRIIPYGLMNVEQAVERLTKMLGGVTGWADLLSFVPEGFSTTLKARSALAATFGATLELAKRGQLEIRQDGVNAPIFLRPRRREDTND